MRRRMRGIREYTSRIHNRVYLAQLQRVGEMLQVVVVGLLVPVVREVDDLEALDLPVLDDVGVEVGRVGRHDEAWQSIVPAKVHLADTGPC